MIGYGVLELFGCYWKSYCLTEPIGYASTIYNNLPNRIKALQILNDNLEERRNNGTLRKAALGYWIIIIPVPFGFSDVFGIP